ncbi:MAG: hypothetical protein K0R63_988 [Rickettsiales bacterium]|jgi:hypothetical protein|nr:hypothetical protein [Rickettsiales bacterium]
MSTSTFQKEAETILRILKEGGCKNQATGLSPVKLVARCRAHGVTDEARIEECLMELIDEDKIEYEMDAKAKVTEFWLL